MEKEITKVLKYFAIFAYYPTLDELYTFLPIKIDKNKLKYTPPQYSIKVIKNEELRIKNSKKKLNNLRFRVYIKLLSLFPQIRLVGLSGSISMMNAGENDDIDLFIITAKDRLFTGRLISLILAQLLGLRRNRGGEAGKFFSLSRGAHPTVGREGRDSRVIKNDHDSPQKHKDKVCLNLFFDENNLKVPKFKQTEFVGHEVLQMKPVIIKSHIYERFLEANRWVFRLFPNAKLAFSMKYLVSSIKNKKKEFSILNTRYYILDTIFNKIEKLLKKLQLTSINCHRTTEIITSTQLWFHPHDYNSFM